MSDSARRTPHRHHGPLSVEFTLLGDGLTRSTGLLRVVAPGQYHLELDSLAVLGGLGASADWHERASQLAHRGEVVHVTHDDRHVVSLGSVTASTRERRATGSARIRLGSWAGAARAIARPAARQAALS